MNSTEIKSGRSVWDTIEAEAGGLMHRAVLLSDLQSNLEAAAEEFGYTEQEPDAEIARLCRELEERIGLLSLAEDGALTLYRRCSRCSGAGKTKGEDPCIGCGGTGSIHAEEADG